jgi:hypothetical protein
MASCKALSSGEQRRHCCYSEMHAGILRLAFLDVELESWDWRRLQEI